MSSQEAAAPAVKGAHTVFFVTNFWELKSEEKEIAQGKAVADACKAAGVKHIIFSSLINVTEASNGRLPAVSHFDGKAKIEKYIRNSGVPATFVLPGFFMSNLFDMIRKNEDGSFSTHWPVSGEKAQVPLFNVADMGKFSLLLYKPTTAHIIKVNGSIVPSRSSLHTLASRSILQPTITPLSVWFLNSRKSLVSLPTSCRSLATCSNLSCPNLLHRKCLRICFCLRALGITLVRILVRAWGYWGKSRQAGRSLLEPIRASG